MAVFPADPAQLAILRELAERGSITAVARATFKSPSAVSQQIKTLERQMGIPLIERAGRGVALTDAGRALAESSVRIATAIAEAQATWDTFEGGASGTVSIALFDSAAELLVPELLTRMKAHPAVDVHTEIQDVSQDDFAPLTADFDIVIAHRSDDQSPPDRAGLDVVELLREPLDVAVPLGHRLAGRDRVSVEEIMGEDWISVPRDYPLDRVLMTMATQARRTPTIVHRTPHLPLIENLVASGHGVALVPRYTSLARSHGRFALVEIADVRAGRQIEALMRPDRAARLAVLSVMYELREEVSDVTKR